MRPSKRFKGMKETNSLSSSNNFSSDETKIIHWSKINNQNNRFLLTFKPEMLTLTGYLKKQINKETNEVTFIKYDESYVTEKLDYLLEPLLEALPDNVISMLESLIEKAKNYRQYILLKEEAEKALALAKNPNNEIELMSEQ